MGPELLEKEVPLSNLSLAPTPISGVRWRVILELAMAVMRLIDRDHAEEKAADLASVQLGNLSL